jgi:ABC-type nitrate/sulfonate/bicarbonate transport system substrate-binding protein
MLEKRSTTKKISFRLLPLIFLVAAAGLADLYAAEAPVRFPFVYGAMSGNSVPLWIAKEQGFFRKIASTRSLFSSSPAAPSKRCSPAT